MTTKSFWAAIASVLATALVLVPSSLSATDSEAASGAAADNALQVALDYVDAHPGKLGVTGADVRNLFATSTATAPTASSLASAGPAARRSRPAAKTTLPSAPTLPGR
jgi:ribulose kinase